MSSPEDIVYINVGKNLKRIRQKEGLSQEKLSELIGANPKFIGHVERFERFISLKKLIQLSVILNVDIKEFFG